MYLCLMYLYSLCTTEEEASSLETFKNTSAQETDPCYFITDHNSRIVVLTSDSGESEKTL